MLINEKVSQAIAIMQELGIDCWVTFVRETVLNGDPILEFLAPGDLTWHSAFILTAAGDAIAIVGRYDKQAIDDTNAYNEVIGYVQGIREPFQTVMKRLAPATIAVNYSKNSEIADGLTHGMYLTLREMLEGIGQGNSLISSEPLISALRQRKTTYEIQNIREAIRITQDIYDAVTRFIKSGKTEKEIAAFMKSHVEQRKLDYAWDPNSCPAVFTGPETAEAHYGPTDRQVEEGHLVFMDFGVKVNGYCSDLQRTCYVLKRGETSAPPDVQKGFDTIVRAIEESRRTMKPGVSGNEIDTVARTIVTDAGYPEFPHALGHQVGRFAHDGTALLAPAWEKYATKPFLPLEKGMVFTIEPRLPVTGRGIATVEEMVIVGDDGAEYLSTPQTQLILIEH